MVLVLIVLTIAVGVGVVGWLLFATRVGLPVSTTHALVGAILGSGIVVGGFSSVIWSGVALKVGLPLLFSPVVSLIAVFGLLPVASSGFQRLGSYCICVEQRALVMAAAGVGETASIRRELRVVAAADCPPRVLTRLDVLDSAHWLSAGLTSFARGLNDSPMILAVGLVAGSALGVTSNALLGLVAVAMGPGSLLAGRRVTGTLATKVTAMNGPEALTANVATSVLVGLASAFGWPVSTTHVSSGAVIAVGIHRHDTRWKLVREMALAWIVTVPIAGALAVAAYLIAAR